MPTPFLLRKLKQHLFCEVFPDFTAPYKKRKAVPSGLPYCCVPPFIPER